MTEPLAPFRNQKYISLATRRRDGREVPTPVWFAEEAGKFYVMTRTDSGKYKRIRNFPEVRVAPCTARGRGTGPWIEAQARVLPKDQEAAARRRLARKYFLMRFPWLWSRKNIFLEITPQSGFTAEHAEGAEKNPF
jgi:PPOX class probable F420-dependent enzyme